MKLYTYKAPLAIIAVCILIGLTPFIVENQFVEKNKVSMFANASVVESENKSGNLDLGINNGNNLDFGYLRKNVNITKTLNISAADTTYMVIRSEANITEHLDYKEVHKFQGNKGVKISFISDEAGYYEGDLIIKTNTPTNEIGEAWMDIKSTFWQF